MTSELYHHGILGMKWGVRRYQNEDGSLTKEGEERYRRFQRRLLKFDAGRGVGYNRMTDDELNSAVNRFQKEKQLKSLLAKPKKEHRILKRIGTTIEDVLFEVGKTKLKDWVTDKTTKKVDPLSISKLLRDNNLDISKIDDDTLAKMNRRHAQEELASKYMTHMGRDSMELYHHGILGQKWGVRRYQNPDGTLTEAGKKRYVTNVDGEEKLTKKGTRSLVKEFNKHRTNHALIGELDNRAHSDPKMSMLNKKVWKSFTDDAKNTPITDDGNGTVFVKASEKTGKLFREAMNYGHKVANQVFKENGLTNITYINNQDRTLSVGSTMVSIILGYPEEWE